MAPPNFWIILDDGAMHEVPLTEAKNVAGLQREIKRYIAPKILQGTRATSLEDLQAAKVAGGKTSQQYNEDVDLLCQGVDISLKAVKVDPNNWPEDLEELEKTAKEFRPISSLVSILQTLEVTEENLTDMAVVQKMFANNIWVFVYRPQERRKFAVGSEAYPMFNFFIEPKILGVFGSYLLQRQFCLLFGHRQSGKTTICQALIRWFQQHPEKFTELTGGNLDDFNIYVATFDSAVNADQGSEAFWRSVCKNLRRMDATRFSFDDDRVVSSETFVNFFAKRDHPSSKPIILIIDEASRLASVGGTISEAAKEITDEFISALRSLKNAHDYKLHAVALVGTESIRELLIVYNKPGASSQISPFTEEATWMAGRFTKAEIKQLFDQFAMDINIDFESADISADIFELTLGHKGLVGACGTYIQYGYENGISPITTIDDWKKITTVELRKYISQKQHYDSMMRSLNHLTPDCKSILTAVLRHGIHEVNPDKDATKYLLAEGIIFIKEREDKNATVECSAPIFRSLILSSITIPQIGLSQIVPDENKLDPRWLLARTIENLCLRHLYSPQALNTDKNPSEYAFQSEFTTVFRNLIPSAYPLLQYKILVEVKERDEDGVRNQRLDILVRDGNSLPSYGFELVVAASKKEFDEHCARAEKYGELHGCEMFMVNLCPKVMLREYFGERSYDLTPVNVVIDPDERKGIIRYIKNDEPVSITGSDWDMLFVQ
ncbi:hypothetical protein BC936DRAFT_138552 [Jimgerdemannia flammicorona]|uniref:ORC1/DEAH AAA+ ATPase domain-containing protein n=1 Tax=Jimgerdemannia flammicorona TaxID=994334 RepID=A0A433C581_9FUNG|nr:hypothetical protein BC936DRAFT_138552 [Jimgerdemannia flammicorona]